MKNLYNSKLKKITNKNLLKKSVLLLSVQYVVTCHAITVTNYRFTCGVVINVIFNKYFSIIIWGELYENYHYTTDFPFKL
jgi:hypothetical protein